MPEGKSEYPDDVIAAAREAMNIVRGDGAVGVISRAILAERHRDRWQPIETAPRNYKPIWGCDFKRGYEAKVLHNGTEWECVSHDGFPMGVGFYPTHWQPLTDLPSPEENLQHD